jgi:hypothetical protein
MNERIRALYEQARLQAKSIDADIDPKGWMDLYHQKFAELIIRESIEVMVKNDYHGEWLGEKVKEHFGVEE